MKYPVIYVACLTASTQSIAQNQPIEKIAVTYKQAYRGDIPQKKCHNQSKPSIARYLIKKE